MVDSEGKIIAGNGTWQAAKELGWEQINVVVSDLSPTEALSFAIGDNKIAEASIWDLENLSEHLKALDEWAVDMDWEAIGFTKDEIKPLLNLSESELNLEHSKEEFDSHKDSGFKDEDSKPEWGKPIKCTAEQREVIDQAIKLLQIREGDAKLSEGRSLELIAAEFLSGH